MELPLKYFQQKQPKNNSIKCKYKIGILFNFLSYLRITDVAIYLHIFFGQVSKSNHQMGESQILTETTPKNPLT